MKGEHQRPPARYHNECPQCAAQASALAAPTPTKKDRKKFRQPWATSRVISMRDYVDHHLTRLREEITELEEQTSQLMSRLIREQDQSAARRLQRDIGRLESAHAHLMRQGQRYQALRNKF